MHRYRGLWFLSLLAFSDGSPAQGPGLGVEATPAQVAAWDIDISPDGTGLPPGSGTAARGAEIYAELCAACHGPDGSGGPNNRLAGGFGSLDGPTPVKTVGSFWPYPTTLFDYVRRAMPYMRPDSLPDDSVYSLTAYLLFINGIVGEQDVLDADSLPLVEMPNRRNFVCAYSGNHE